MIPGSGDITKTPGYCLTNDGYLSMSCGVKPSCRYLFRCAYTQRFGALAIRRSAVRVPCAASDAYFEKIVLSSRSYSVTLIHGYCLLNAATSAVKFADGGLP